MLSHVIAPPFALPQRRPRGLPPAASESGSDAEVTGGLRRPLILAVDDEPDALEILRVLLVSEGFDYAQATSGAEAFAMVGQRCPDLVIVDVMMAGMTGFELCDLLRSSVATRHVPVIVYSAHETKAYSNTGLYDLAFVKPADPEELLWAIRTLLPE